MTLSYHNSQIGWEVHTHGLAMSFFFQVVLNPDDRENEGKRKKEGFLLSLEPLSLCPINLKEHNQRNYEFICYKGLTVVRSSQTISDLSKLSFPTHAVRMNTSKYQGSATGSLTFDPG